MTIAKQLVEIEERRNKALKTDDTDDVDTLLTIVKADREAMRAAMNELGVPQPDYPAPVANAYELLSKRLQE